MEFEGTNFIAGMPTADGDTRFHAIDPRDGSILQPVFVEATRAEVARAAAAAAEAFRDYARLSGARRAEFLRAIADELIALDTALIERAHLETALPIARLEGERARTVGQLRLFADLLDEGSWVDARIDRGDTSRTPAPKPDLRRMLVPLGPVAVFGASNFPFAFSVPGGDTASALAAGCTVVCKAHPAHPGTSELAARAIDRAARACEIPAAVFSLLHGWSHDVGLSIVRHPAIAAVGFTGSLRGGRAIFDAAASRPEPIPVYAEMGSVNPVFLLPSALESSDALAQGLAQSITMGTGQFCTNPGIVAGVAGEAFDAVATALAQRVAATSPSVMLYPQLGASYREAISRAESAGASSMASREPHDDRFLTAPQLLRVDAARFTAQASLHEEMFGPVSMVVAARDRTELEEVAECMEGQLTATIHGTAEELQEYSALVAILQRKVGRLLFNGYPTGVEVGHAMHHGGPYPASTDSRSTSVGSAAILRFARPICYQNFPAGALPEELRDDNPRGIWRMVDGTLTRAGTHLDL